MGNSFIESSLKRYLKRKVKFTMALLTIFLITGSVGFAKDLLNENSNFSNENKPFINAETALKGLGNNTLSDWNVDFDGKKITIANGTIKFENFGYANINGETEIDNNLISNKVSEQMKQALANAEKNGMIGSNFPEENMGIIDGSPNNVTVNNGIIAGQYGQTVSTTKNVIAINNGIIKGENHSQRVNASNEIKMYNYGILIGNQIIVNNSNFSTLENHGLILSSQQIWSGQENEIFNYGIISNSSSGQTINAVNKNASTLLKNNQAINYGIINVANAKGNGQYIAGYAKDAEDKVMQNSFLKNYGYIASTGKGQYIYQGENNTAENYGVIKADGYAIEVRNGVNESTDIADGNVGINYGTVIKGTDKNVFSDGVTNKGLVIVDNSINDLTDYKLGDNKGIVITESGTVLNKNTVAEYTGSNEFSDTFTDSKSTAYVTGTGNTIKVEENDEEKLVGKLTDKVIGTIVENKMEEGEAVFKIENGETAKTITLENTVLTGYFKNDGTLLDMGNNNLTLLGDTKIVASKDNFDLDNVAALNINGLLKKVGSAEIAGKISGSGKLQDIAVNGDNDDPAVYDGVNLTEVLLQNATADEENYLEDATKNYTNIKYNELETNKITLDFQRTADEKENTITFTDNLLIKGDNGIAIDGRTTTAGNNVNINFTSLDNEKVQGDIRLGASDDDIVIEKNGKFEHIIDLGAGTNTLEIKGFADGTLTGDNHKKEDGNIFDYKVNNVGKIVLNGKGWHIGENAELNAGSGTVKSDEKSSTELHIAKGGELHVEMNNNFGIGNVTTSLDNIASDVNLSVTTEENAEVKFVVGDKFDVSSKQFEVAGDYSLSGANLGSAVIFKGTGEDGKVVEENGKVTLVVKEASELELENYKGIYDAVLGTLSKNDDLRNAVNYQDESSLRKMITKAGKTAEAFYTTGYAVTKDVADTYMSVVEDFGRKAGAGEWIAFGKYINSDTEFDGGNASKGYDGDITGTVGMLEYGVNNTTSYGIVYGQGDTEVDINGGGKLDGDNTYFGGYVKHRTENGIDLVGNIGYTKSELDLSFASDATVGNGDYHIITDGNSDANALTLSLRGKKDYSISETVKLQPVASVRYSFITQDEVTSSDASYKMDEQDITIFEGSLGANIVKEFELNSGKLALIAGTEYVLTDVNKSENARYTLYEKAIELTGEDDIADNRIEAHIGAEYIHENGVGFEAKYEAVFTDKGDSNRITAGVSHKF